VSVGLDFTNRSLKAQMREAARLGARFAALLGEDELRANTVTLRDMESGEQESVPRAELGARLRDRSS